jgi:hypothetical protein
MFTLIKREIEDNLVYFLAMAGLSGVIIFILVMTAYYREAELSLKAFYSSAAFALSIPVILLAIIGLCAMGSSQMYIDKHNRISSFLATLPVTRLQIFIARLLTGVLAILIFIVPVIVVACVVAARIADPMFVPFVDHLIFVGSICAFLLAFACYCTGLQTGWTPNRVTPTLGAMVLTLLLIPIILIKGIILHAIVILACFIIASIFRTWTKFMSTPL